jgi:hypothetical protein
MCSFLSCLCQLTLGCRMLHYTGIGRPSCLIFEKEKPVGETNVLGIDTLTDLFAAGGVKTQLVFVSAGHSENVAQAFIAAGVRECLWVGLGPRLARLVMFTCEAS